MARDRLGLFEHPYTTIVNESERYLQPESKAIVHRLASESMVLLKNTNNVLPLSASVQKVALIGPLAKEKDNLIGSWGGHCNVVDVESIYEGFQSEFKAGIILNYAKGCDFDGTDKSGFADALTASGIKKGDRVAICV